MTPDGRFSVLSISRHRITVDGEGVTTLVGLSGCPLSCRYCINKRLLHEKTPRLMTPEELWERLAIDYCYFVATGGGVTFGGGEPLLHSDALRAFREVLPEGVSVTLETSLNVPEEVFAAVLPSVDRFIIDVKDMDGGIYEAYTGVPQTRALRNLALLAERGLQDRCTVRVPLIPDFNSPEDTDRSAERLTAMGFTRLDRFSYVIRP